MLTALDPVDRTLTVEVMGKVESARMMLWHVMMARGQGHLAHHVLEHGFKVIEFLRWCHVPMWNAGAGTWTLWRHTLAPYLEILQDIRKYALASKMADKFIARVGEHLVLLGNYGQMQRRADGTHVDHPPGVMKDPATENTPCEPALSPAAEPPSPQPCSPAATTGSPSAATTATGLTQPTRPTSRIESTSAPSDLSKPQSSRNTKRLRGTGHPKRPNPYTKPKRGKA